MEGIDKVRKRTRFAHDVIAAMGENELAAKVVEHSLCANTPLPQCDSLAPMPERYHGLGGLRTVFYAPFTPLLCPITLSPLAYGILQGPT